MKPVRTLLCAALLAASVLPAWADIGREAAASVAQRETGGRVLSVDRVDGGGRPMWRVKVVTARGDVRVVFVDAATGQTR